MTPFEERVLQAGFKEINAPYIWTGKGDCLWSQSGPVPLPSWHGFDCSGYVQWCLWKAGQADRRMLESAQTMFTMNNAVPPSAAAVESRPLLAFYGKDKLRVSHVAILTSLYGEVYSLQSAGGGQHTTTIEISRSEGSKVQFGPATRQNDLVGLRFIPQ